jgi:hypothetical protein
LSVINTPLLIKITAFTEYTYYYFGIPAPGCIFGDFVLEEGSQPVALSLWQ